MLPRIPLPLGLVLLAAGAAAQTPARGALYTRVENGLVRAVIRIEIDARWHLYHEELGHPKAIGQPTRVTLSGEGIEWGPVRFPEPIRIDQSEVAEPGTFILAHEHELVLYAAGRLAPGATAGDVKAKLKGLVCEDVQGCIPYREELASQGAGPDKLFAAFPADLLPARAAPAETSGTSPPETVQASPAPDASLDVPPAVPREDRIEGGNADTTLYVRIEDKEARAALEIAIEEGWHLYHTKEALGFFPNGLPTGKPTEITLHGAGIEWERPIFPAPVRLDQSDWNGPGAHINAHEGTIVVYVRGKLAPGATVASEEVWGEIHGQTCSDLCLDYDEIFVSRGRGPEAAWSGWDAALAGKAADEPDTATSGEPERKGLLWFLLAAIGGGLFALVMPCTYPMIPITISFFTKQADKRGGTPLSLSLAYGAGIVLIFVLIGVVFGSLIIPFATHPLTNLVIAIAFVYFALVLFGLVNLQPPRFLMNAAGAASTRGGYAGVFLMGATLVITSFTCTAPFVGSLLSIGASDGNVGRIALGMAVFGLTMAVPFVFLSLVPGRLKAMPRSGEWMNTLKVFMGFVELAAALKFFSNSDLVWQWELLSRELFLLLWGLIFVVASAYLLGAFPRQEPRSGTRRLIGAAVTLLFALYCFWGMSGRKLDLVMTAIAPNYSGGKLGWKWYETGGSWTIVKDDYDAALELAQRQQRLLLVNFTGFT
jgi:cytochrome c biogenesis protein CcdA/DsbC/DsbD-like thiol-disulfide interchange protein